jgi:cytochrome oxidase Cu insertion factor (SCO1/SenC/PrrC family)
MNLSSRVKLLLIASGFALPIAASFLAYHFLRPEPTGNYGELLLPPHQVTSQRFEKLDRQGWDFTELRGRWALVASGSGACGEACIAKLTTLRQVQQALGRRATRVARVFVVDDLVAPDPRALEPFEGTIVAITPRGLALSSGAANDRAHVYLVDPKGHVMMRWPAGADRKRMLRDLERLLKASQIG